MSRLIITIVKIIRKSYLLAHLREATDLHYLMKKSSDFYF